MKYIVEVNNKNRNNFEIAPKNFPYAAIISFDRAYAFEFSEDSTFFTCRIETSLSGNEAIDKFVSALKNLNSKIAFKQISGNEYRFGEASSILFTQLGIYSTQSNAPKVGTGVDIAALEKHVDAVETLIGWDSFKQHIREVAEIAPIMQEDGTLNALKSQCYLISINDGCGLTTAIQHLTVLYAELGLYNSKQYYKYKLSPTQTVGKKIMINDLIPKFSDSDNKGVIFCIDISEYTAKSMQADLKNLLLEASQYLDDIKLIFRVNYLEPKELKRIEEFISDIILTQTFAVPPYTNDELIQYAASIFPTSPLYYFEEDDSIFIDKIREEKMDGCFYGFRTMKKIIDETIILKHIADTKKAPEIKEIDGKKYNIMKSEDIKSLLKYPNSKENDPYEELRNMIGMEPIIEQINEIVTQIKTASINNSLERPCMHMRFVGAPGTGKTTVARLIGKIFAQEGILSNGQFFEYTGRDLVGVYIGETAPKTLSICRDAYGSILFLDEAYELYKEDNPRDFGSEALATLIAEMENHRDNFVVIMAGYSDEMERLMKGNAGLRSRMPFCIKFPSYNRTQLVQIYMSMVRKHFQYENGLEEEVAKYFESLSDNFIKSENFSNARFVRNLYERTWSKSAMRAQMNKLEYIEITISDFKTATLNADFKVIAEPVRNRVGY